MAAIRPVEEIVPLSGVRIFAMHLSSVDLPEPLCPSRPKVLLRDLEGDVVEGPELLELARERCQERHP